MKKKIFISFICSLLILTQSISVFAISSVDGCKFKVEPLPYAYDALEPYIDKETMTLHHDKHYNTYVDKLNAAILKHPELCFSSLEDLLANLDSIPTDIAQAVRNNGGGAYNHEFFFSIMTDNITNPSNELLISIERDFGSYDNFKEAFKKSATEVFGSGWTWLVADNNGKLSILNTANQDSPITLGLKPIIGIDVWEHAYYLNYQNRRAEYIDNWFNVVNWDKALEKYKNK